MFFTKNQNDEICRQLSYASFPPDVLDDYSKIVSKFEEADIFDKHLKTINDKVKEALEKEDKLTSDEDDDIEFIKKPGKLYTPHYHVLTDFFNKWLQENGFNIAQTVSCIDTNKNGKKQRVSIKLPAEMLVIIGLLYDDLFSAFLLRGILAKDLGAGVAHGEFTHLFQIYAIVEENKQNKFLQNDPVKLIKQSAPYFYMKNKEAPWRLLFDYVEDENFRSPYFFNATVNMARGNADFSTTLNLKIEEYPVLVQLLQGRSDKRESKYRYNAKFYSSNDPYLSATTKKKYLTDKPGVVLNNAIFFPIEGARGSRHLLFDDINAELVLLKEQMLNNATFIRIQFTEDVNANVLDNLIKLFSKETFEENKTKVSIPIEDTTPLQRVAEELKILKKNSEQPNETLEYRPILMTLLDKYDEIRNDDAMKSYYQSLLEVGLNILEKAQPELHQVNVNVCRN